MGVLTPNKGEILLHRRMFEEKANLLGIPGKFYHAKHNGQFNYRFDQDHIQFEEPIYLHFIFDSMPSIKTLKNYGWYSEDLEDLPCVAYLPWIVGDQYLDVCVYSKLTMADPIDGREKSFLIQNVNGNLYYCINWVVKCVPYREEEFAHGTPVPAEVVKNNGDYRYINK